MSVGYGKGDKGLATSLHSKLVRYRAGRCERCGIKDKDQLTAAHILTRSYSWTRVWSPNLVCLCYSCHRKTEQDPGMFVKFLTGLLCGGSKAEWDDYHSRLRKRAIDGVKKKMDWGDERLRVERECWDFDRSWASDVIRKASAKKFRAEDS